MTVIDSPYDEEPYLSGLKKGMPESIKESKKGWHSKE